ncbi:glycosyltransferase family 4 protein [Halomonas sp. 15WGF]|uniref:glycosyltransferase family 4 protein n=1 Tax=Halomonas sp. 15WGF TaxID=2570357 RepID=UPI0010BF5F45|nr:glycosyltransferase family 4 protein [Halomonas sp. 15WGF]TKJ10504.1 glycosyltransferase family 4 protein [Halomonas sp. 15WGF]
MSKKVLQVCLSGGLGGTEFYVDRIIDDLRDEGWGVYLLCLSNTEFEKIIADKEVGFNSYKTRMEALLSCHKIAKWLKKENIKIVHCHKSSDLRLATCLKLINPSLKVFFTDHNGGKSSKKSLYHRFAYSKLKCVFSISRTTYERNKKNLPVDPNSIKCLPHGVNTEKYRPYLNEEHRLLKRRELGIADNTVAVCLPGRVTPGKGQQVWVKALLQVKNENFVGLSVGGFDARTGGDEALYKKIKEEISLTKCEDKIKFVGHRSDIIEILPAMDIVCVPSKDEAFGLVVIESMASGVPVVGARSGALPEIIDEASGVLVDPESVTEWAKAIEELINNKLLRQQKGHAARQRVQTFFSHKTHVTGLIESYQG